MEYFISKQKKILAYKEKITKKHRGNGRGIVHGYNCTKVICILFF